MIADFVAVLMREPLCGSMAFEDGSSGVSTYDSLSKMRVVILCVGFGLREVDFA